MWGITLYFNFEVCIVKLTMFCSVLNILKSTIYKLKHQVNIIQLNFGNTQDVQRVQCSMKMIIVPELIKY